MKALFNIGCGVYILTTNSSKLNGCIVNSVMQITSAPTRVAVCVNKDNFSTQEIQKSKKFNLSILGEEATFDIIKKFGFFSGRDTNKFEGFGDYKMAENNVPYLSKFANSYLSLSVIEEKDIGTHVMFICDVTADVVLNSSKSITYAYYQDTLKPKKKATKTCYVCSVCGYVYEGDPLPDDFICPLCKHGASDFVKQEVELEDSKEASNNASKTENKKSYTCLLCGYTHEGDAPPEVCPTCGQNMWKEN